MISGFSIDSTSGSYKRRGSSPAEQNHWSICSWIGENFTGELTKLLLALLERHRHKCTLAEERLNEAFNDMKMTIHHLEKESPGSEELKSAQSLNNKGHELFLKIVSDSHNYVCKNVDDGSYQVYRVGYESISRSFEYLHSRCTCNDRVANEKQCVHEFTLTNKFEPTYWSTIYHRRDSLTKSQHIGNYKNPVFTYDDDKAICTVTTQDIGVVEDFLTSEITSAEVSNQESTKDDEMCSIKSSSHINMTNSSSSQSMRMPKRKYTVLSHTDMMEVAAKLSAGSQRNKKFGTAVSALMLQMLDICDGKIPSTISINMDNNLDHHFERIVHNYKTSFKSVTDVSVQLVEEVELPPKAMHHERSTTKRLIPNVEK